MHAELIMANPGRIQKARMQEAIEKRTKELQDYLNKESKTISKTVLELWKNFEYMVVAMADHYPAMSPIEIEKLSAWKFYHLKSYISKKNKPKPKHGAQENE